MNTFYPKTNTNETTQDRMVSLCFTPIPRQQSVNQVVGQANLKQWFPMRVTYHREMKIKALLDAIGIESFLPMHWIVKVLKTGKKKRVLESTIPNLIFVRATQQFLTELKTTHEEFAPMRYMTKRSLPDSRKSEIIIVPDKQMANFMKVASVQDDSVMALDNMDFNNSVGKRVRVIDGTFKGVEGIVKRIKNNKRVVVCLEGVAAMAITFVPPSQLEFIK